MRCISAWLLSACLVAGSTSAEAQFMGMAFPEKGESKPAPTVEEKPISDDPKTIDPGSLVPAPLAKSLTVDFQETAIKDVITTLQEQLQTPIYLNRAALEAEGLLVSEPVTDRLQDEPAFLLLNRLENLGLGWYFEDGVVHVTTLAIVEESMQTVSYNLGDLLDAGFLPERLVATLELSTGGPWEQVDGVGGELVLLGDVLFARHTDRIHRELAGLLAALRQHGRRTFTLDPPRHEQIRAVLDQPVSIDFRETPLSDAVAQLSQRTGVDIRIDRLSFRDEGIRERIPVSLQLADQKLRTVLRLLLADHGLNWTLHHGVLWVTTGSRAEETYKTAAFDVRDLCRNDEESQALERAIQSQTRASWSDREGVGGTLDFPRPGIMVVRQTEPGLDQVLALLENYRAALRGSKPRKQPGPDPAEILVRYYHLPDEMATELMTALPELVRPGTWQTADQPDAPGHIRRIPARPALIDAAGHHIADATARNPGGGSRSAMILPQAVLIIRHTREAHDDIGQLLVKLQDGDPFVEPELPAPSDFFGGFGGGFGGVP